MCRVGAVSYSLYYKCSGYEPVTYGEVATLAERGSAYIIYGLSPPISEMFGVQAPPYSAQKSSVFQSYTQGAFLQQSIRFCEKGRKK